MAVLSHLKWPISGAEYRPVIRVVLLCVVIALVVKLAYGQFA